MSERAYVYHSEPVTSLGGTCYPVEEGGTSWNSSNVKDLDIYLVTTPICPVGVTRVELGTYAGHYTPNRKRT